MLCKYCKNIKPLHIPSEELEKPHACITRHHSTFRELIESARSGCELCALFAPWVEGHEDYDGSEEACTHEDPFSTYEEWDEKVQHEQKYHVSEYVYYLDDGGPRYYIIYDLQDPAVQEEYDAIFAQDDEDDGQAVLDEEQREILKWLEISSGDSFFGPQQLWMTVWKKEYQFTDEFHSGIPCNSTISISAGSFETEVSDSSYSYCFEGEYCKDNIALAFRAPGLWTTPYWSMDRKGPAEREDFFQPCFEFFQKRDKLAPQLTFKPPINARDVAVSPREPQCFRIIRQWISDCQRTHPKCRNEPKTGLHPQRLVRVGSGESTVKLRVRDHLKELASNDSAAPKYAALSHCWGRRPISRLTLANYHDMLQGIPLSSLSQSFQDAITICRELGIRYLWIDALCIVQDDKEDWARESAKMAAYYGSATVTISALDSDSAHSGILRARSSHPTVEVEANGHKVYIRDMFKDTVGSIMPNQHYDSELRHMPPASPLTLRCWTLQERLFSNRIVHYTDEQIVWQCRTCFLSEDSQHWMSQARLPKARAKDLFNFDVLEAAFSTKKSATVQQRKTSTSILDRSGWYATLKVFSKRNITIETDRLPALSSLASEIARYTNFKYLAGQWDDPNDKTILLRDLLWKKDDFDWYKLFRVPTGSPTWSWSSARGDFDFEQPCSSMDDVVPEPDLIPQLGPFYIVPATSDPYGQLLYGRLECKGMIHTYTGSSTFDVHYPHRAKVKLVRQKIRLEKLKKFKEAGIETQTAELKRDETVGDPSVTGDSQAGGLAAEADLSRLTDDLQSFDLRTDDGGEEEKEQEDTQGEQGMEKFHYLDFPCDSYDWETTPHICLYFYKAGTEVIDSDEYRRYATMEDCDMNPGTVTQHFLILKRVGTTQKLNAHDKPVVVRPELPSRADLTEESCELYERVGVGMTDSSYKPMPISEEHGWRREHIAII